MWQRIGREEIILKGLNLSGSGLEYGPLHKPMAKKPQHNVRYVDFADRARLVELHKGSANIDTSKIPEIDIVTGGRNISEFVKSDSVDFIVASHVAEHVPDLLSWLMSNLQILKKGGLLSIAYPDKRFTFDIKRHKSSLAEVIAAHLEKRTKPSISNLADHFLNVSRVAADDAWVGRITPDSAKPLQTQEEVLALLRKKVTSDLYTDCHCWIFDDIAFLRMLEEVRRLFKLPMLISSYTPTPRNSIEFYVTLTKT